MPKERNFNPVQAQRKADKAKAIKKGKADLQERRNEKLGRKNPERIQKQIDDLRAVASSGGKLTRHEEEVLAGLEKEVKAVRKAREALGDSAPAFGGGGGGGGGGWGGGDGVLGKRRRDGHGHGHGSDSDDDDVPADVREIPMPRDTPPPMPKEVLDAWHAKRREAWQRRQQQREGGSGEAQGSSANAEPVAEREGRPRPGGRGAGGHERVAAPPLPPAAVAKTVYESAPVVRDLRKEAVSAFVPAAVRAKLDKAKGQGAVLMEPEEADMLEQEGYLRTSGAGRPAAREERRAGGAARAEAEDAQATVEEEEEDDDDDEGEYDEFGTRRHRATVEDVDDDEDMR